MAIEVPKIQDEVSEFLKRFSRENSFASKLARDKFMEAMNRMPSSSKVEFITAYLNDPTASGKVAGAAMVKAIEEARGTVAEEVLASTFKNYARRLSDDEKRELAESVRYSANEATASALAAIAKEAGLNVQSGPIRAAVGTRTREALTLKPSKGLMAPAAAPLTRTETPEDKARVSYTGQDVWFAPEDRKEENPIRVGVKFADNPDLLPYLESQKARVQKLLTLARIKAQISSAARGRTKLSDSKTVTDEKTGKIRWVEVVVVPPNPAMADKFERLLLEKESEYGMKAPDLAKVRDLEIQLGYIQDSINNKGIGGYIPVNPNEGLKRVKVRVKKEVMRGRGKKRGLQTVVVEEMAYVPKEIVGPGGSAQSVDDAVRRFDDKVRDNVNRIIEERGIDPDLMQRAAGLSAAREKDKSFQIPDEYTDAVSLFGEIRAKATLEAKASTPTTGATRIAKGTEFQDAEEARAFKKAFKKGPAIVREMILSGEIAKIATVPDKDLAAFREADYFGQMKAAQKLFKKLSMDKRRVVVEDVVDFEYAPFKWRVGPSGVVDEIESVQADAKAITMMEQKPELYPVVSASRRLGGARRSDEPSPTWVNLRLFNVGGKLKPQQRLAQSIYLNPDWISQTFGTEALSRANEVRIEGVRREAIEAAKNAISKKQLPSAEAMRFVKDAVDRAKREGITRWDLAQAGYNPFGEEADIIAAEVPVTLFSRASEAWEKDTFRKRNENVTFAPMVLVGKGDNKRLVPANSPEGKRFLIETNATAYMYGDDSPHSFKKAAKGSKELIDLAKDLIAEDLAGEGYVPDENPKLFYDKIDELLPMRVNILLLDSGPLISQNLVDAVGLYNERLRSKTIAPKQAIAGGLKATPIRADPKSDAAIRAEAGKRVSDRYGEKIAAVLRRPPPVEAFERQLRGPGRTSVFVKARARQLYNDAVRQYAEKYDSLFQTLAQNWDREVAEEEARLRRARGVIGFRRTKEEAAQIRQERKALEAAERAREEAAREAAKAYQKPRDKENVVFDRTMEGRGIEDEIRALEQEKRLRGSSFPGFKQKRLLKLIQQQKIAIEKKKLDGLGFGFGSYDLGSKITITAVGGLVAFGLFKALTSKGNQS
jgi:hypothetical protein